MRRILLLNALIFAVLAAAAALAYYSFSATSEHSARERELALMQELAEEKVVSFEQFIDQNDTNLMREINLDEVSDEELKQLPKATGALVVAIYVLDENFRPVPNGVKGFVPDRITERYTKWFFDNVVTTMPFGKLKLNERGHMYVVLNAKPNGEPRLFSFMRRRSGTRTYNIVVEDDFNKIIVKVFEQFFRNTSKRVYEVLDDTGTSRYGHNEFGQVPSDFFVEQEFHLTFDGWKLRIAQRDEAGKDELRKKRVIDSVLIGGAVTVILAGLGVLGWAIRRERRLSELKSEFISNVSHELKTPLSIISMFGEMLANGRTKGPEQATEYAEIIWRESVRLGRLIDNVLDFAKIERGAVYEFDDADVGEVVERAVELSARRVAAAEMTLDVDIEPELPVVRLDANAFTLAVLNLIDNAIKYAADGKKIDLAMKRDGDRVVLTVRDYGPGIDPDEHERIFERFYRARAIRLKPIRGSGIGLALVQHIARAHGGDATVTSAKGEGSTFRIWLPVA